MTPATITISATASDADGITRVDFFANDLQVGTATAPPYTVTWQAPAGSYSLVALATFHSSVGCPPGTLAPANPKAHLSCSFGTSAALTPANFAG